MLLMPVRLNSWKKINGNQQSWDDFF
jgi:hypothetical protein